MTTTTLSNTIVTSNDSAVRRATEFAGRVLLAVLFLTAGLGKLGAYTATAAYMASAGVPGGLLPAVIALEVLGSIAIIIGLQTRLVASLLAAFTLATGLLFHTNFADQIQMIMFMKNIAIAGAFLALAANGAGWISVDRLLKR